MLAINLSNLKASQQTPFFVVDMVMLLLILINLTWLVFDSAMALDWVEALFAQLSPSLTESYMAQIHPNYVMIDLVFVSIFLFEFLIRWMFSIKEKTYHRWFFYPFVHWYDLLGCIPLGAFRWLRLLRIFSMMYRLQRYGIIDFGSTKIGLFVKKYYGVLVEEVSDRVVENVLQGARAEVMEGGPVIDKILEEAVLSRRDEISDWFVLKVNQLLDEVYLPNQVDFKQYLDGKIAYAIEHERKAAALDSVPVIGPKMVEAIHQTVSDVVYGVVDQLLLDLGRRDTDTVVDEVLENVLLRMLEPNDHFSNVSKQVLTDTIDILIDAVRVQRWKQEENSISH